MIWMELRCDGDNLPMKCHTAHHAGPKEFAENSATNVSKIFFEMKREARKQGWLIKGSKIYCPGCRKDHE